MQFPTRLEHQNTGSVCAPEAGPGAGLVANLMLAVLYCVLQADAHAKGHIARACQMAQALPAHGHSVRVPHPMKVLRVWSDIDDTTTIVHLPLLGDSLLLPDANVSEAMLASAANGRRLALCRDLELAYVELRLRPRRILAALSALNQLGALPELARAAQAIIDQCIFAQIHTVAPLDRVGDYFTLAGNLVALGNPALSHLALQKANAMFSVVAKSSSSQDTAADCRELQIRLHNLLERFAATASPHWQHGNAGNQDVHGIDIR